MPRLTAEVRAGPVDWARWATAVPMLVDRFKGIEFDPDGVARFPSGRREGLRLTRGERGAAGSRYRVVTTETELDPGTGVPVERLDPPTDIEIAVDHASELQLFVTTPDLRMSISLLDPARPTAIRFGADGPLSDLPAWLGEGFTVHGAVTLTGPGGPKLTADGALGRIAGNGVLGIVPDDSSERLRATLAIRPSGALAAADLLWPFVRGRVRREVERGLADIWAWIAAEVRPDRSVEDAVEAIWTDSIAALAERVPSDT